jgi:general transcription factor 3C polypeptide 3 (transcription factor C subunit 4)
MEEFDIDSVLDSLTDGLHSRAASQSSLLMELQSVIPESVQQMMNLAIQQTGMHQQYRDIIADVNEDEVSGNLVVPMEGVEGHARMDEILPSSSRKKGKKSATYSTYAKLPENLATKLSQANMFYVRGENEKSVHLLHEIIQARPETVQAWSALAMMHEEQGDDTRAIECNMMAAHISKTDAELWSRLGHYCKKVGVTDQALYCFQKASKANTSSVNSLWEQGIILRDQGCIDLAIQSFEAILKIIPNTMVVIKELAKLYLDIDSISQAILLFEAAIEADQVDPLHDSVTSEMELLGINSIEQDVDEEVIGHVSMGTRMKRKLRMGYEELNMLAELYVEAFEFEKALTCIKNGIRMLSDTPIEPVNLDSDDIENSLQFPISLRVKMGISRLHVNNPHAAKMHFAMLYEEDPVECAELFFDVAEAYIQKGNYETALNVFHFLTYSTSVRIILTSRLMCLYYGLKWQHVIQNWVTLKMP